MKYTLLLLLLVGCVQYKAPRSYEFVRAANVKGSIREVTDKILAWSASNGFAVHSADNGVVLLKSDLRVFADKGNTAFDCGTAGAARVPYYADKAEVSIVLQAVSNDFTHITVNAMGDKHGASAMPELRCNSTGAIELSVLTYCGY